MESGAVYTFSPGRMEQQLERLEFILAKTRAAGRSVASVNLQMERNVPVRFFARVETVPAAPKAGSAVPLAEAENVGYTPAPRGRSSTASPAGRKPRAPAASSEQQDIQTILRGT